MQFRTEVNVDKPDFEIEPCERMLFVGSCFADNIGRMSVKEGFRAVVNPYGVMYNPASVTHTVRRFCADTDAAAAPRVVVMTLGTNHVYILRETGEIVDNCRKRPQSLFREEVLTVDGCYGYLQQAVDMLTDMFSDVRIVVTVSPIRYAKYGYHGSALSKSVLLLAADRLVCGNPGRVTYFPAYEIVNDELRDYRFYSPDMLHPSQQAVEFIWERFSENFFSERTKHFINELRPIWQALSHRPFNPESEEYLRFKSATLERLESLRRKYPDLHFIPPA